MMNLLLSFVVLSLFQYLILELLENVVQVLDSFSMDENPFLPLRLLMVVEIYLIICCIVLLALPVEYHVDQGDPVMSVIN